MYIYRCLPQILLSTPQFLLGPVQMLEACQVDYVSPVWAPRVASYSGFSELLCSDSALAEWVYPIDVLNVIRFRRGWVAELYIACVLQENLSLIWVVLLLVSSYMNNCWFAKRLFELKLNEKKIILNICNISSSCELCIIYRQLSGQWMTSIRFKQSNAHIANSSSKFSYLIRKRA